MVRKKCLNEESNRMKCPCPEIGCPRRGICCECIMYHLSTDGKTACM